MKKLSVIIPAYKEPYLERTVNSFLEAAVLGDSLEVLVVLDGPWLEGFEPSDYRVRVIQREKNGGMRAAINSGLEAAQGEYVLKVDAHCTFAPGFDKAMVENCEDDCLTVPRRYALDDGNWMPTKLHFPRDHHYLTYPLPNLIMSPHHYRPEKDVGDETMAMQGSCWLAHRRTFMRRVGFLNGRTGAYGDFAAEQLELCLKYWLGGAKVKLNRDTWYAHLHKNPRHYQTGEYSKKSARTMDHWIWATRHWVNDKEPGMVHPFSWLVEKFWPIPGWPDDWRKELEAGI